MNDEGRRGGWYYDDEQLLDDYLAHRHAEVTSPNLVMEEPAFRQAAGPLHRLRILDLGCGDGTFAAECTLEACAHYHGIDGSSLMIDRAAVHAGGPAATFEQADIEDYAAPPASFDLVTSRMALHYVRNIEPVFRMANAALVPGGRLLITVVHPVVTAGDPDGDGPRTSQVVDNYFHPGDRDRVWFGRPVRWQHRTIEQYVAAITCAGFTLDTLRECEPVASAFAGDERELERRRRVPLFLLLGASRG